MEVKKSDLTFFKNEVLEDLTKLEKRLNEKINSQLNLFFENIEKNKEIISEQNSKIFEIMKIISNNDEQIKIKSDLSSIKFKLDQFSIINNSKLSFFEKELHDITFKYDKLFINNLTSPGLIGDRCQFPNTRDFFEFVDNKLKDLSESKDMQNKDMKMYKEKLENLIGQFKLEISLIESKLSLYCNELLKKFELKTSEKFLDSDNKINNIRIETNNFISNINKKIEIFDSQWDKMRQFRDNVLENFETKLSQINSENKKAEKEREEFKEFNKEFNKLKSQFVEIEKITKKFENIKDNFSPLSKSRNKIFKEKLNKNKSKSTIDRNTNKYNSKEEDKNTSSKEDINNNINDIATGKIKSNGDTNRNMKNIETQNKKEINPSKSIDVKINQDGNNININGIKTERVLIKENIKKEFLQKELSKLAKNKRNSSTIINSASCGLKENIINNNKNKMNNTNTKKMFIKNGASYSYFTNPDLSNGNINKSQTRTNFYKNCKNNDKNGKIENLRYQHFVDSGLHIINFSKQNERKIKLNNSAKIRNMENNKKFNKNNKNFLKNNGNFFSDDEQYLYKEEFYFQMKETQQSLNDLYSKLNNKIKKISIQIKNISAEIFGYYYSKKLNNKYLSLITKNKSTKIISSNSSRAKHLIGKKQNLKYFPKVNDNLSFNEDEKMSSKDLFEKLDSFLIKKIKD